FVGSTRVAKIVYRRGTANLKRVLALGGAKNHLIVMPDAEPDMTSSNVVASMSGCAGQRCMAASVMMAVGNTDHIVNRMVAIARVVGVNVGVPVPREPFGFGGWNESKFGVGDITGRGSIEFWTKSKKMTTKWNKEAGVNWMS